MFYQITENEMRMKQLHIANESLSFQKTENLCFLVWVPYGNIYMAVQITTDVQHTIPGEDVRSGWYKDSGEAALSATNDWVEGGVGNRMIQKVTDTYELGRVDKMC